MTEYVVTRWYRAPEVILNSKNYTYSLDMWSIGCIFGELIFRETLFPGQHNLKQIDKIIEVLGYPEDEEAEFEFIKNEMTLNYIKKIQKGKGTFYNHPKMANANPLALDLLMKMLRINPSKRITI